jgi:ABC-type branched-subunit amino acid transport system permease subunit
LKAVKENEPRAVSLGYDVDKYKLVAFVLSAALAGLAGATKTLVLGFETLTDVHWTMSGLVVLMTLVGGLGTLVGRLSAPSLSSRWRINLVTSVICWRTGRRLTGSVTLVIPLRS